MQEAADEVENMDAPPEEEKQEEKQEAQQLLKPVSIAKMYSLITCLDVFLIMLGMIGAFGNAFGQPLIMIGFGDLIDSLGDSITDQIRDAVGNMLLIACGVMVCASLQDGCWSFLSFRMGSKLKVLYFDAVINQDVSWFDAQDVMSLPTRMSGDMTKMAEAYGAKISAAIQGFATFFAAWIAAFLLGWQIALATLATVPFAIAIAAQMAKVTQQILFETQGWYAKAASTVEEALFAVRTVVSFGGEKRELATFQRAVENARKGGVKNAFQGGVTMGFMDGFLLLQYGWAFWYASTLIYGGTMNPKTGEPWQGGEVLTVFFCILVGGFVTVQIEPGVKAMNEGRLAGANLFEALENTPVIQRRGKDERKQLTSIESFQLKNVHFSYPARPQIKILNGTSLTIKRGQKVALVGESGSGKSTVMALLERFYDPTEGEVLVNNMNIKELSVTSLRSTIGYVGQEPVLFATSIRVNIMQGWPEAQNADLERVVRDANLAFVDELPDKLDTFVGSGGSQFSGGQKQRIAIARALLKKPSVLFLDEATSALDNASEKMIQATVDSIAQNTGDKLTIVSIAHRLSTVMDSDRIYALKDGLVSEFGTHTELMAKKGLYYGLAAAQQLAEQASQNSGAAEEDNKPNKKATAGVEKTKSNADVDKIEEQRQNEIKKKYKVPMRRLLGFCTHESLYFVPGVIGAIIHGVEFPAIAYLMVSMMDSYYKPKEQMRDDSERAAIAFVAGGVIVFVATIMQRGCFGIIGEALTYRLRVAILTHIFRQEVGFHDDPKHTASRMSDALQFWAYRVSTLISSMDIYAGVCGSVFVGVGMAFIYCWQMTAVMIGSIPILVGATAFKQVISMGATKTDDDKQQTQQILSDAVQNVRTVQAIGIEKVISKHYRDLTVAAESGTRWRSVVGGFAFGVAQSMPSFTVAGGFYFASYLLDEEIATFREIMLAFLGVLFSGIGAGMLAGVATDASKAKIACHDLFQLFDRRSQIDGLEPDGEIPNFDKSQCGHIEFSNIQFVYPFRPEVQVLKGVNFKIKAGQSVGLVGPSGGGKSTIMFLIQRFYDPIEGSVIIGSVKTPLNKINIRWWRRQIGFVGQEPVLFNTTVRKNVLYGFEDGEDCPEWFLDKCKAMSNLSFIDSAKGEGWDTQVGPRGSRLSGGQKQRVAICRAIVRDPPILMLDEATSALDSASEQVVQQSLEAARAGRTSFTIAHRLSTVSDCDCILVAAEGIILEQGTHDQLMAIQGVYYKLQVQGKR